MRRHHQNSGEKVLDDQSELNDDEQDREEAAHESQLANVASGVALAKRAHQVVCIAPRRAELELEYDGLVDMQFVDHLMLPFGRPAKPLTSESMPEHDACSDT